MKSIVVSSRLYHCAVRLKAVKKNIQSVFFFLFPSAWGWNSGQSSPTSTKDFKKFVVIRVAGDEKHEAGLSEYQKFVYDYIIDNYYIIMDSYRPFSGKYQYKWEEIGFR